MPTVTFLIGIPAAGKSTMRELIRVGSFVASSDDFIESIAKAAGKTYDEVFKQSIDAAVRYSKSVVSHAVQSNRDLIIDSTNMSVKSRRKFMLMIPDTWTKRAIVLTPNSDDMWELRLKSRPGKNIPTDVLKNMVDSFEMPTKAEGFSEILVYWT
jgi:tRNA uridine 5-carbamoylmethylation protein Kti12